MKVLKWTELKQSLRQLNSSYLSRLIIIVCLPLSSLILISCQTTSKKTYNFKNATSGIFVGNIYIKDTVKNKSFVVNFKTQVNEYTNLRLDVTAALIGHLASVTVNEQSLQYMIPRERKYYSGSIDAPDIKKHLPFPVSPKILSHVFWGTPIEGKGWKCSPSGKEESQCIGALEKIKISWKKDKNFQPELITVKHSRGLVKFLVKDFTPGLTAKQMNRFVMRKPSW